MARKKKLSDLLREEVGKELEAAAEVETQETASGQEGQMKSDLMTKSLSRMTKADLLSFVKDLRAALQAAQEEVSTLGTQLEHLEAVDSPPELDPAIAEQLEQAKQDALRLAKENKRLLSESKDLNQENTTLKAKIENLETAAAKPAPLAPRRQPSIPQRRQPAPPPSRSILARPIRSVPPRRPPRKFKKNLDALGYD